MKTTLFIIGMCNITNFALSRTSSIRMCSSSPINSLINLIQIQNDKEEQSNIWKQSTFEKLPKLQTNDIGKAGEQYIQYICNKSNITSNIDGTVTKNNNDAGDGTIKNQSVEIKTAHLGLSNSFQHELGEHPWSAKFMIFVDIAPNYLYLSIFPNFSEQEYKLSIKCSPYFPSRSICWRKKSGSFKLDTSIKSNEDAILRTNPNTMKIIHNTTYFEIDEFINRIIK